MDEHVLPVCTKDLWQRAGSRLCGSSTLSDVNGICCGIRRRPSDFPNQLSNHWYYPTIDIDQPWHNVDHPLTINHQSNPSVHHSCSSWTTIDRWEKHRFFTPANGCPFRDGSHTWWWSPANSTWQQLGANMMTVGDKGQPLSHKGEKLLGMGIA